MGDSSGVQHYNMHPRLGASMTMLATFGGVDKMISGKTFR